jgi:hypothetical protein
MTLDEMATAVRDLRTALLFDEEGDFQSASLPPRSEQNFIAALAHLELATCELKQADYHRMQNQ